MRVVVKGLAGVTGTCPLGASLQCGGEAWCLLEKPFLLVQSRQFHDPWAGCGRVSHGAMFDAGPGSSRGFLKWMEVPQNGWFTRKHPIKMDDLGLPLF